MHRADSLSGRRDFTSSLLASSSRPSNTPSTIPKRACLALGVSSTLARSLSYELVLPYLPGRRGSGLHDCSVQMHRASQMGSSFVLGSLAGEKRSLLCPVHRVRLSLPLLTDGPHGNAAILAMDQVLPFRVARSQLCYGCSSTSYRTIGLVDKSRRR